MAFVRVKKISGSEYAYLVENTWTERGTRQRVGKYLGRIYKPDKVKSEGLANFLKISDLGKHIRDNNFGKIAQS